MWKLGVSFSRAFCLFMTPAELLLCGVNELSPGCSPGGGERGAGVFLEAGWALLSLPEGRNKITADELGWEEASAAAPRLQTGRSVTQMFVGFFDSVKLQ